MEKREKNLFLRALGGGAIGLATGFFGGGGGMIAVPLLSAFGLQKRAAHATAILVIFPVAALSLSIYFFEGLYDLSLSVPVAVGVFLGGTLGAKLLGALSEKPVSAIFALLQLFVGGWLFFRS